MWNYRESRKCGVSALVGCLFGGLVGAGAAHAGDVLDRVRASGLVRVCIVPDYPAITFRDPRTQALSGIDIELSREFAKDLGVKLEYVDSSNHLLVENLLHGRCDVAMHAVGITPQLAQKVWFSEPYLRNDVYAVTTRSSTRVRTWDDIDRPGVVVGVRADTHVSAIMATRLRNVRLEVMQRRVPEQELEAGRVDVFLTDCFYSTRLQQGRDDWARVIEPAAPVHETLYAYAIGPEDDAWRNTLNRFVGRMKSDGRLAAAASRAGLTSNVVLN